MELADLILPKSRNTRSVVVDAADALLAEDGSGGASETKTWLGRIAEDLS